MTTSEFSNEFDVLYNNVTSNQAPGLDEYEKSVFLTKAQNEIVKNYFNPKGNKYAEGVDGNEKRQIDFSMIMETRQINPKYDEEDVNSIDGYNSALLPLKIGTREADTRDDAATNDIKVAVDFNNTFTTDIFEITFFMSIPSGYTYKDFWMPSKTAYTHSAEVRNEGSSLYVKIVSLKGAPLPVYNEYYKLINIVINGTGVPAQSAFQISAMDAYIIEDPFLKGVFDTRSYLVQMPEDLIMTLNEKAGVRRKYSDTRTEKLTLNVVPINYQEYHRILSKPYKYPLKNQAWRLLSSAKFENSEGEASFDKFAEVVVGPNDALWSYNIRYIKRPRAIILGPLGDGVTIEGSNSNQECELDPILHPEILQRAVELAKAAYVGDLNSSVELGKRSE